MNYFIRRGLALAANHSRFTAMSTSSNSKSSPLVSSCNDIRIALVTAPSKDVARTVASVLLSNSVVACVNIIGGIESHYTWENKVNIDEECLLIIKTTEGNVGKVGTLVREHHPYDCPELISVSVESGFDAYLQWIRSSVKNETK